MAYNIQTHIAYNAWATMQIANVLRMVDDEIYFKTNKSSFPSVAKTVQHVWGAQEIWLTRMKGESLSAWPNARFENSKSGSLDGLVRSSDDFVGFVRSVDESFLEKTYAYKNMKGEPFEDTYEETLFHVVNHGTYHRGQIITMLREAGVTTVTSTDLILYLRALKK